MAFSPYPHRFLPYFPIYEIPCSSICTAGLKYGGGYSSLLFSTEITTAIAVLVADIRARANMMGVRAIVLAQAAHQAWRVLARLGVILAHVEHRIIRGCIDEVERRPIGGIGTASTIGRGLADAEAFWGADFGTDEAVVAVALVGGDEGAFELVAGRGVGVGGAVAGGRGQADADWVGVAYVRALGSAAASQAALALGDRSLGGWAFLASWSVCAQRVFAGEAGLSSGVSIFILAFGVSHSHKQDHDRSWRRVDNEARGLMSGFRLLSGLHKQESWSRYRQAWVSNHSSDYRHTTISTSSRICLKAVGRHKRMSHQISVKIVVAFCPQKMESSQWVTLQVNRSLEDLRVSMERESDWHRPEAYSPVWLPS